MPYIRPSAGQALRTEVVEMMARAVDLPVPPEDVGPLATMLTDQLASAAALEELCGDGADPPAPFDPRWPERMAPPSRAESG